MSSAPYCPDHYSSAIAASNAFEEVPDPRWATETDCQYFYPGFQPNHLLMKQRKEQRRKVRHYDPSAYARPVVRRAPQDAVANASDTTEGGRVKDTARPVDAGQLLPPQQQQQQQAMLNYGLPQTAPQAYYASLPADGQGGSSLRLPADLSSIPTAPASEATTEQALQQQRVAEQPRPSTALRRKEAKPSRSHSAVRCTARALKDGREAPDSSFIRPFHAYGWKNTKPVIQQQYMKTHSTVPPRREVHKHTATRRSRSLTYRPEEDAPPAAPSPAAAQQQEALSATAGAVPQVPAGCKEVFLEEGRMKLCVFPGDSPAELEAAARRCLGVPPHMPLLLADGHGRPVVLSHSTVGHGETLTLAGGGAQVQVAGFAVQQQGSLMQAVRDLPSAGRPSTARLTEARRY